MESVKVKENSIDDEVNNKIGEIFKKAEINRIKNYLPEAIDLKLFPLEKDKKNFDEDIASINTEFTIIDTCDLINDLDEKIKQFRIKNKLTIEKEKK